MSKENKHFKKEGVEELLMVTLTPVRVLRSRQAREDNHDTAHDSMMSQSTLIQCAAGDVIWLESGDSDGCRIDGNYYRASVFGGFLVQLVF